MKYTLITVAVLILGGAIYWLGSSVGLFGGGAPSNPPTKDELERMEEIEESSSQIAPDAEEGVGVRPVGST
jgi:hypothetical protein